MLPLHLASLFFAIVTTPWFISRLLLPRQSRLITLAGWGPVMVAVNVIVPVSLHLLDIAITPDSLACAHILLAGLSLAGAWRFCFAQGKQSLFAGCVDFCSNRPLIACAILFALLVLPVSHLAGIDTYKWQDLAGNVAVEQRISWLIHPLSLLGFTPRSYSSAQPLVLATIEILGHTGVDWGFYILSVAFGMAGLSGAWVLARHLFKSDTAATWFGILYIFSPVFMRYNYWATGRGLTVALLPVYLLVLLKIGEAFPPRNISRWKTLLLLIPAWFCLSLLLSIAHKAGLIGAGLIPILFVISPVLALVRGRWGLLLAGLASLMIGLILADGNPLTLTYRLITRFGWLLPLFILALVSAPERFGTPSFRAMLSAGLATLVLSCTPDMYGALLALPFITFIAAIGFETLAGRSRVKLALILIPALAIVINQTRDSPDAALYRAACFIEQHDPRGPFRIEASGAARRQIQAYVSGCPRFTVRSGEAALPTLHHPPHGTGSLPHDARAWIDYLRRMFELRGADTDWYGDGNKVYYVTVDGLGTVPPQARQLFQDGNVAVFEAR
ncbi:MAG: hypothetical protein WCO42_11765 [bacterium]